MKPFTKRVSLLCTIILAMYSATVEAQISLVANVITQPCNNNGQIGVTVTGLTPPISYTYSNQAANVNIIHSNINSMTDMASGLKAYKGNWPWLNQNLWIVTASNTSGSASQTIILNPPFIDSVGVIPAICPASSSLEAINFVGGTPPFTCLWTRLSNAQTYNTNPAAVPIGNYTFVITDAAGCMVSSHTFSGGIIYVSNSSGITLAMSGTPANCTNGTAMAVASGGTAPYTYQWNNNAITQSISGLISGLYNCTVTDAQGCQSSNNYYVSQNPIITFTPSITHATCIQNNGSILGFVNGGTAPYTFLWTNAATTQNISGLAGNTNYQVQITDANGCIGSGSAFVNSSTPISVTYTTSASSCTSATGAATIIPTGGVAPYTFIWYNFPTNTTANNISNKSSGNYPFKVTDANGCIRTGTAFIPPISTINASLNYNPVVCPTNVVTINSSVNGSNPPFTYQWSNSTSNSSIANVPLGNYHCVITDAVGCSVNKSVLVAQQNPISVGFITTPATCIYSNNGALQAVPSGGTAPYTYFWSNSQTGANLTGVLAGNYYVTVTDANGCHNNSFNQGYVGYNPANNSCYCTITGTVYADANSNCVKNTGELGLPNIQVHCSGLGYTYSDANGVYSFLAPSGTYTISESVQQIYPLASCQSNNQVVTVTAASNCSTIVNFANNVIPIHDLKVITTNINLPVPGNLYSQKIIVQNDGTMTENTAKFAYKHDGQLSYNNSLSWPMIQPNATNHPNWFRVNTGFPTLSPGASSTLYVNYNVPFNIPINTVVNFQDSVAHNAPISTVWLTDNTPWNNVDQYQSIVVASYDPNFKEVSPRGMGVQGGITTADSILTYVVHFQNEGTYFAQNIVVIDTLDSDLRISSLKPGYSDHKYTVSVSENGVMKFTFKNINLPWKSAYGNAMSSGLFSYTIRLKKNLAIGTQIKNNAAIYFDYNEPIITNTTLNTIEKPNSLNELKNLQIGELSLYPNPSNSNFNLVFNSSTNQAANVSVYDINGKQVLVANIELRTGENSFLGNVASLQNGIYIVQLKTNNETVSKKLVVSK